MSRMLFDFKCGECSDIKELFVDHKVDHTICNMCGGVANKMISPVHGRVINPAVPKKIKQWRPK